MKNGKMEKLFFKTSTLVIGLVLSPVVLLMMLIAGKHKQQTLNFGVEPGFEMGEVSDE